MTVILPTRNRAAQLEGALEHLAAQETGGAFTHEVLIVDNGSTDTTRQVVEAWQSKFPVPLRYLHEPRPGKPWALNSGMAAARGAFFAFTDDDIRVTPGWLAALWWCFQEERADGVGGRILPQWTAPRPAWLTDEACRKFGGLGCVDHGEIRRASVNGSDCRWVGGSFALRREAAARLGPYDSRLFRGEETEYYERALRCGLSVCYEPAAVVFHRIGAERMTHAYFRDVRSKTGHYRAYRMPWKPKDLWTVMPLWWYLDFAKTIGIWLGRQACRHPWVEQFASELAVRERMSMWRHRLHLWPRECRRVLGAARRRVACQVGIARLLLGGDATARALGRALAVVSWKRLSRAEALWAGRIEALRAELEASTQTIRLENYGVGRPDARSSEGSVSVTTVGETCRRTSKSPRAAQLLMAIVRRARPERCLELGTSLGISGAYQAAALELSGTGRLVTLEGASAKAALARTHFQRLGLERVSVVTGRFQDTLPGVLRELGRVDVAFVDGHHDEHATVAYFQQIVPRMPEGGVLVFDDIEWSDGMRRAWRSVQADARVRVAVTLGGMGMCVAGAPGGRAREIRVPLDV